MKIYDFTDLFDFAWGDRENKTANITDLPEGDREFGVRFTTPNNSEEDVRMGIPMMAFVMNKNTELELRRHDKVMYSDENSNFSFFVNHDGKDPKPTQLRDNTTPEVQFIDRETHLFPNTEYVYVQRNTTTNNQPAVVYQSSAWDDESVIYGGTPHTLDGVDGIWFSLS